MPPNNVRPGLMLINEILESATDVAPVLSDRMYRLVATPLHRLDPIAGADAAENRLDGVRDRVARIAARRRVEPVEWLRIQRALARTRDDLDRLTPRLPRVRQAGLRLRLDQYTEAIALLDPASTGPDGEPRPGGSTPGLFRRRAARRRHLETVAGLLAQIDETTRRPRGVDLPELDQARQRLMRRVLESGRLDQAGAAALGRVDTHLNTLMLQLLGSGRSVEVAYLVKATICDYLPDTLDPFLAMEDPNTHIAGRPAGVVVTDQLTTIGNALAEAVHIPQADDPNLRLLLQDEFLRARFGGNSESARAE